MRKKKTIRPFQFAPSMYKFCTHTMNPFTDATVLVEPKAKLGIPSYEKAWERYQADPKLRSFSALSEGFSRMRSEQAVIYTFAQTLFGHLEKNPKDNIDLKVMSKAKPFLGGIIFQENSPLVPVFRLGIRRLRESGSLR